MSIVTGFSAVRKAMQITFFENQNVLLIFLALPVWYGFHVFVSGSPPSFHVGGFTVAGQVSSVISQGIVTSIEILVFYWVVRGSASLLKGKSVSSDDLQSNHEQNRFRWSFIIAFSLAFIVMWDNHLGEMQQEKRTSTLRNDIDERIDYCLLNNIPSKECITDANLSSFRSHE